MIQHSCMTRMMPMVFLMQNAAAFATLHTQESA